MVQEQYQRTMSRSSRHTREFARKLSKLTEVQAVAGWGLILLIIASLGVIYLNQSSKAALVGRHAQQVEEDLLKIERVNSELESDIAKAQDITRLKERAEKMGFITAQPYDIEYMAIPKLPPIMSLAEIKPKPINKVPQVETIREGLWIVFESSVSNLMRGESSEQ